MSNIKIHPFDVSDFQEQINVVKFEDYSKKEGINNIDFIKLDIEGHELADLIGMGNLIKKIKVFQFEFGGCNIDTRTYFKDFYYFFKNNNFDLYRITPIGSEFLPEYRESDEFFSTTNYIAVNPSISLI